MEPCIYYKFTTVQFHALSFWQSWKANYALECDTHPGALPLRLGVRPSAHVSLGSVPWAMSRDG